MISATSDTGTDAPIRHQDSSFVTRVDGHDARIDYRRDAGQMVITHTSVPDAIGGRGIAGQLTRAAFEHAKAEGWSVRPECSYAAAWAERHPEYSDLIA